VSAVDLFEALRGIPPLPGALCRGEHELFDDTDLPDEALELCSRCPALAGCTAWFEALPARHRPRGVIAGRVHKPKDAA
jgi:WhiB family redox-sensing transcriptional regulator